MYNKFVDFDNYYLKSHEKDGLWLVDSNGV